MAELEITMAAGSDLISAALRSEPEVWNLIVTSDAGGYVPGGCESVAIAELPVETGLDVDDAIGAILVTTEELGGSVEEGRPVGEEQWIALRVPAQSGGMRDLDLAVADGALRLRAETGCYQATD